MTPETLSRELRLGSSRFLRLRRKALGLSLLATGAMTPIALYQMGIIKHLPEPPLPILNADKVDAASEAYAVLATPDAVLGIPATPSPRGWRRSGVRTGRRRGRGFPWRSRRKWRSMRPLPPS